MGFLQDFLLKLLLFEHLWDLLRLESAPMELFSEGLDLEKRQNKTKKNCEKYHITADETEGPLMSRGQPY